MTKHFSDGADEDTPGSPACFLHELDADGRVGVGVGFPEASIPTVYPQPHDVPMNWIVTGAGPAVRANPVRLP